MHCRFWLLIVVILVVFGVRGEHDINVTTTTTTITTLDVVVLLEPTVLGRDLHTTRTLIEAAFVEQFGATKSTLGQETEIQLRIVLQEERCVNEAEEILDVVCSRLPPSSIAVVLFGGGGGGGSESSAESKCPSWSATAKAVARTLGQLGVAVVELGRKGSAVASAHPQLFPTLIRISPPTFHQAMPILMTLHALAYRQVIVLTVKGGAQAESFVETFEAHRQQHDVQVQRYISVDVDRANEELPEQLDELTSNIIVLFCDATEASQILEAINSTLNDKLLLLSEDALSSSLVPVGSIGTRLVRTDMGAVRDAFGLLKRSIDRMDWTNGSASRPPDVACTMQSPGWTALTKQLVQTMCRDDEMADCSRRTATADIVNVIGRDGGGGGDDDGKRLRRVGSVTVDDRLVLDEPAIRWGASGRPREITLPSRLRIVVVHDPPLVYVLPGSNCSSRSEDFVVVPPFTTPVRVPGAFLPCGEEKCCAGYAIDLISLLAEPDPNGAHSGFSFDLHFNTSYGAVLLGADGYYLTGAIGELDADTADLVAGGLTINAERERHIDFSAPWLYTGIRIVEKTIPVVATMESFVQPLQSSLWMALAITVFLVGLVVHQLDRRSPFEKCILMKSKDKAMSLPAVGCQVTVIVHDQDSAKDGKTPVGRPVMDDDDDDDNSWPTRLSFGEAMWFVWGVLLNSGVCEKTPRSFSARVLGVVWCGFCMIITASYTANLAAFLVLDQPHRGLQGVSDPRLRNPSANFSFATVRSSNVYQYFKRHVELSTMHRKMEAHNVERPEHALASLLNGTLDAFIWDGVRLEWETGRSCSFRTRGALFGRSAYGVGARRGSPWTQHITRAILRLSESGRLEELDTKWMKTRASGPLSLDGSGVTPAAVAAAAAGPEECPPESAKSPARLGLTSMRDVFVLVGGGVLLGVVLSSFEVIYGRAKIRRRRQVDVATRFARRWRAAVGRRRGGGPVAAAREKRYRYPCTSVLRAGFAGLEAVPVQEVTMRRRAADKDENVNSAVAVDNNNNNNNNNNSNNQSIRDSLNVPVPNYVFTRTPAVTFCSRCTRLVETTVERRAGMVSYLWCTLCSLVLMWPCAAAILLAQLPADVVHRCPVCRHRIAHVTRCGRQHFHV